MTPKRNGEDFVASLADDRTKAFSFGAENEADRLSVVKFVKIFSGAALGADQPKPPFLQILHGLGQVGNSGHPEVFERTGGNLSDDLGQAGTPSLRKDNSIHSGPFGASKNRSQVLGIFDLIQQDQEGQAGRRKDIFKRGKFFGSDKGNDPLVERR